MPRKNKSEETVEEPVEETVEKSPKASKDAVTVTYRNGKRVYSKELHGSNFNDLAKEFATKVNGTVS